MKIIGLTGGIATGKSTVSAQFVDAGIVVIDADALARDAIRKGRPAWGKVVARFGRAILDGDGRIDRTRLGAIVFGDDRSRADLEAIIHPEVFAAIQSQLAVIRQRDPGALVVLDMPLLLEVGDHYDVDLVVVVAAPEAAQLARLMARDGLVRADALARIHSQMPLAEKMKRADVVIDNGGAPQTTREQVAALIRSL